MLVMQQSTINVFDLGYLGVETDFPEQLLSSIHNRKQRNLDLSQEEKECNKNHSKKRIGIEQHLQIEKVQDDERRIQK